MRKIAVVAGGDKEHADFVGKEANKKIRPLEMNKEDAERCEMEQSKRNTRDQRKPCAIGQGYGQRCNS
jgi:hypothetical protein